MDISSQKWLRIGTKTKKEAKIQKLARGSQDIAKSFLSVPHSPSEPKGQELLKLVPLKDTSNVLELLAPGSFVTLDSQPNDLPPFEVIYCQGGGCLVRQQTWGKYVQWEVEHRRLKSA